MISPSGLPMIDARCNYAHRGSDCSSKDDYRMVGSCGNCKSKVVARFTVGHEASQGHNSPACPICQCRSLYWDGLDNATLVISTDRTLTADGRQQILTEWAATESSEEATP